MKVLIACEESQKVCSAFRECGHEAFSCDIQDQSGGHPEWHIQGDALEILNPQPHFGYITEEESEWIGIEFWTTDGAYHRVDGAWDLIIAHPPCTYLTVTGNRWFNVEKYGDKARERERERERAAEFFMEFINAKCNKIAVENPVGYMNTHYRKPDQIIQPYMFGEYAEKKTCLWLKGLPNLNATNVVTPPSRVKFKSGRTMPKWYAEVWGQSPEERAKIRSKTFPGIAKAMAEQWGE